MSGKLFFPLYLPSFSFFQIQSSTLQKATSGKYFFRSYLPSFLDPIRPPYKKQDQVSIFSFVLTFFLFFPIQSSTLQKQRQVSIFHLYLPCFLDPNRSPYKKQCQVSYFFFVLTFFFFFSDPIVCPTKSNIR